MVDVDRQIRTYQKSAEHIKRAGVLRLTHSEDYCSKIGSSLFRRRAARAFSRHPVFLTALCAALTLGVAERASAQSPPNCTAKPLERSAHAGVKRPRVRDYPNLYSGFCEHRRAVL